MTPSKAIRAECRICMNSEVLRRDCNTTCKLKDLSLTALQRIKAHCLDCIPEHSLKGVQVCSGILLNGKTCPLHPYRHGHNPKRQGIGNKNAAFKTQIKKALSASSNIA